MLFIVHKINNYITYASYHKLPGKKHLRKQVAIISCKSNLWFDAPLAYKHVYISVLMEGSSVNSKKCQAYMYVTCIYVISMSHAYIYIYMTLLISTT